MSLLEETALRAFKYQIFFKRQNIPFKILATVVDLLHAFSSSLLLFLPYLQEVIGD